MNAAADRYHARFRRVLDFIDAHLDESLDVERLSSVAAFSKFHFHRQFSELFGIGVYGYLQQCRFKRAAFRLAFRSDDILEIALASGYEGPEAFSRAFKKSVGQAPSEFRRSPRWKPWHATNEPLRVLRSRYMSTTLRFEDVRTIDFPPTRVAKLEHCGDPDLIGDSLRAFIAWRKEHRVHPRTSATFNVLYNDPSQVEPARYRLDLCAATDQEIGANAQGVVSGMIPGGRCAVLRLIGSDDRLDAAFKFLYSEWLPRSGEEPRDFPLFLQRVKFFPDVPEHEAIVDIFLPLQ